MNVLQINTLFVDPSAMYFNNWISWLIMINFNHRIMMFLITSLMCCLTPEHTENKGGPVELQLIIQGCWTEERMIRLKERLWKQIQRPYNICAFRFFKISHKKSLVRFKRKKGIWNWKDLTLSYLGDNFLFLSRIPVFSSLIKEQYLTRWSDPNGHICIWMLDDMV